MHTTPPAPKPNISDQRRILEVLAVFATGLGKFVFMDWLEWRLPFVLTAILGWIGYLIVRGRTTPGILPYWGFRLDNFGRVFRLVLPFSVLAIGGCVAVGLWQNTINPSWHLLPILLLYPIWGSIQQFLMIGLVAGNLQDLSQHQFPRWLIILFTALLFAAVHYPDLRLVGGTFVLALFYTIIYLKARNVYVLGIFHGWLGGIFYFTVVNRDPFVEVFGHLSP